MYTNVEWFWNFNSATISIGYLLYVGPIKLVPPILKFLKLVFKDQILLKTVNTFQKWPLHLATVSYQYKFDLIFTKQDQKYEFNLFENKILETIYKISENPHIVKEKTEFHMKIYKEKAI